MEATLAPSRSDDPEKAIWPHLFLLLLVRDQPGQLRIGEAARGPKAAAYGLLLRPAPPPMPTTAKEFTHGDDLSHAVTAGPGGPVNAIETLPQGPPDPKVWDEPEMRAALVKRDFGLVYRLLGKIGYSQQRIAALTGQSQPEVSAIIHGRKVMALDVIERIVWGLGIPPAYAGLACRPCRDTAANPATCSTHVTDTRVHGTPVATVDVHSNVWDRLVLIATEDYPGATPSEVLVRLLAERDDARTRREIVDAYKRLQSDSAAWAAYLAELDEWEGLPRKTSDLPATIIESPAGPTAAGDEREDGCED